MERAAAWSRSHQRKGRKSSPRTQREAKKCLSKCAGAFARGWSLGQVGGEEQIRAFADAHKPPDVSAIAGRVHRLTADLPGPELPVIVCAPGRCIVSGNRGWLMTDAGEVHVDVMRQLMTLNRIARIAAQDLQWRPMLQRIVDTLADEFGWDFVACATIDRERSEFMCEAVCGSLSSEIQVGYRRPLGSGVVGTCALEGRTMDIDDAHNDPLVVDTLFGTGSELCVPVTYNNQVLAVLNAESRQVGAFRGQRAVLETVAGQIAGILHAANLYEQLQQAHIELRMAYADVERLSQLDSLTGVPNRRVFEQRMSTAARQAILEHRPLAVLLIDVDHFKQYNDCYGHPAGDDCLCGIADLLSQVLTGTDAMLARYGGEEFVIMLPGTNAQEAKEFAEHVRLTMMKKRLQHREAAEGVVTISIGIWAGVPVAGAEVRTLIESADVALYRAKRNGRNCVVLADS